MQVPTAFISKWLLSTTLDFNFHSSAQNSIYILKVLEGEECFLSFLMLWSENQFLKDLTHATFVQHLEYYLYSDSSTTGSSHRNTGKYSLGHRENRK